jgi:hypothetical protein
VRPSLPSYSRKIVATISAFASAAIMFAPTAGATMIAGNYELRISGRDDFHTWAWAVSDCGSGSGYECRYVNAIPMPVAKAFPYTGAAHLIDGRYTLTVDVLDGLRCGNIYYGPVIATRDTYSWDAATLQGTMDSSFSTGCDGAPGGTYSYPFTLVKM